MIYIIRVRYDNCTLLKIGYTGDNNFKNRMTAYKLHNPLSEVIYTISGGTEEDEKSLHLLFNKFLYKDYGNEWFYEDQEILDFFDTNRTKQDLDKNLPKRNISSWTRDQLKSRIRKTIFSVVNRWLCLISNDVKSLNKNYKEYSNYIKECRKEIFKSIKDESDVLEYLVLKYSIPESIQNQIQDFIDGNLSNPPKVSEFLYKFKDAKDFTIRLRMICEIGMTDQERGILLDQIPLTYKNYYETLGPERCKALGYNKTYIEREYSDLQFDISRLIERIEKEFLIGYKYSKSEAKEKLGQIYSSLGYNKKPKANDLEEYFEIKACQMTNKNTGKRDHGFEILKKKEK